MTRLGDADEFMSNCNISLQFSLLTRWNCHKVTSFRSAFETGSSSNGYSVKFSTSSLRIVIYGHMY